MKKLLRLLHPATIISTCFYVGKIPFMPGTFGSFAGLLFVAFIFFQPHLTIIEGNYVINYASGIIPKDMILPFLFGSTILIAVIGTWAADVHEKIAGKKDPGEVVIDEVAGIMVAFSMVAALYSALVLWRPIEYTQILIATPLFALVIFILFRVFDIWKPWHIRKAQDGFKGGFGIMIDDLIAGVYSAIIFFVIFFIAKYFGFFDFYFGKMFTE